VNGRTVLPLTQQPNGVQAWKMIIPADQSTPSPRVHDGYEWLYVLSGRMRLILGDRDFVLGVGEAAKFDTQLPHWFGSTGEGPAEVLSIFGRPGERMHVHAQSDHQESGYH
jgi:quercetin dioxygenase-like cupin family protein